MLKIDSQLENQTEPRLAGQPTDLDARCNTSMLCPLMNNA